MYSYVRSLAVVELFQSPAGIPILRVPVNVKGLIEHESTELVRSERQPEPACLRTKSALEIHHGQTIKGWYRICGSFAAKGMAAATTIV